MRNAFLAVALSLLPVCASAQSVPDWQSYLVTGNPNDIVRSTGTADSVSAWLGKKVDVNDGSLNAPNLNGGRETYMPTDRPGSAGTSIPNTIWVDENYQPRNTFISAATTWTVCASGCTYTSPLDAWNAALAVNFLNGAVLTISIADGTYSVTDQIITATPRTKSVHVIGDTADPSKVVLNFTNLQGNNFSGFMAVEGGNIGLVDGMTIHGVGQLASQTASVSTWNSNSWGAAFTARGGTIQVGAHIVVDTFYYIAVADNGGYFYAPNGMTGSNSGDVNFMARHNGVLECLGCTATRAADNSNPTVTNLGCNYLAESGGAIIITNSTGSGGNIGAVCGLTNGHGWAHGFHGLGGLNGKNGNGANILSGASIEIDNAEFTGYNDGVYVGTSAYAEVSGTSSHDNAVDGYVIDGGYASGNDASAVNNGNYGIEAFHQGRAVMFGSFANFTGNSAGVGNVQAAGTMNGLSYTASSIDLE